MCTSTRSFFAAGGASACEVDGKHDDDEGSCNDDVVDDDDDEETGDDDVDDDNDVGGVPVGGNSGALSPRLETKKKQKKTQKTKKTERKFRCSLHVVALC